MNPATALFSGFVRYASFKGRSTRLEYWTFTIFALAALLCAYLVDRHTDLPYAVLKITFLALIIPLSAVATRRLHDTDRSDRYFLAGLIPIVGQVALIYWLSQPGTAGENRYG